MSTTRVRATPASPLPTRELRFALLDVRLQSLRRVLALEEPLLQLALEGEPFREARLQPGVYRALDVTDRAARRPRRRELPGVLEHGVAERSAIEPFRSPDLGDEPQPVSLVDGHQ